MNRSILPARPLRLRFGYVITTYAFAVLMLAIGALCAYMTYEQFADVPALREGSRLWDEGVPAIDGAIHGKRTSKFGMTWFIAAYELDVSYDDAVGATHHGSRSFWTLLGGPDTDGQAELRYDAKQPDHFVTSWE